MIDVFLSVSTAHRPATYLGYLLAEHPDRAQTCIVPHGTAHVCYPDAGDERCTAAPNRSGSTTPSAAWTPAACPAGR